MYSAELFIAGVFIGALVKSLATHKEYDRAGIINALLFAFAVASSSVFLIPFVETIKYFSTTIIVPFMLGAGYGAVGEEVFKRFSKPKDLTTHDIEDMSRNMKPVKLLPVMLISLFVAWLVGYEWAIIGVLGMFFVDVAFYLLNVDKTDIVLEHYHVGLMLLALYIVFRYPILFGSALYLITSELVQEHSFAYGKPYFIKSTLMGVVLLVIDIALMVILWV